MITLKAAIKEGIKATFGEKPKEYLGEWKFKVIV